MTNATDRAVETGNKIVRDVIAGVLLRAYTSNYEGGKLEELYDEADQIFAALDSAGLVIVPKEPTGAMLLAARHTEARDTYQEQIVADYRAMIAAKDRG